MPTRPKLHDFRREPKAYPGWIICPRCQGGRGEIVVIQPEEGDPELKVQVCSFCNGDRVIEKTYHTEKT